MKAPFPYFGGKRTIAETVWRAFGRPSSQQTTETRGVKDR